MKHCNICNKTKEIFEFGKDSRNSSGLRSCCKECRKKEYKPEKKAAYNKVWYAENKEDILGKSKKYYGNNKEDIKKYKKEYYESNKEEIKKQNKEHYDKPETKQRVKKNQEVYRSIPEVRIRLNKRANEYTKKRNKEDILFKLKNRLRSRLSSCLRSKGWSKNSKLNQYLGCSMEQFKQHIESKFQSNMTWNNHGKGSDKWQIDHIYPLSLAKSSEEMIKLCHYTNLQPLWTIDNVRKGNKICA